MRHLFLMTLSAIALHAGSLLAADVSSLAPPPFPTIPALPGAGSSNNNAPAVSMPPMPVLPSTPASASGTDNSNGAKPVTSMPPASPPPSFSDLKLPDNSLPSLPELPGAPSTSASNETPPPFASEKTVPPLAPKPQTAAVAVPAKPVEVAASKPEKKKKHMHPYVQVATARSPSLRAYRCEHLPATIYEKKYDRFNRHLPVAYYESDYDKLAFIAAARDDLNGLRALLDDGRKIEMVNANGDTLLLTAVKHNAINTARLLLARHAAPDAADAGGHTALDIARQLNNYPMVRALEISTAPGVQYSRLPYATTAPAHAGF